MSKPRLIVKLIGTAQDGGFPQAGCRCAHCLAAKANPVLRRTPAALALILPEAKHWHLVDATPSLPEQLAMVQESYPEMGVMQSVTLTHAHIGHYTGLMHLGREVMSTKNLPVYAGEGMTELLRHHAPWKQLVDLRNITLQTMHAEETFALDEGLSVTPLLVPHRNEFAETFGFIIAGPSRKLLYIPDIDRWEQWDRDLSEVASEMDFCLLDATFYSPDELAKRGRDYREVPHPLITTTMDLLQGVVDAGKTKVYLTHLNHTNPAVMPDHEVRKQIRQRKFYLADEGMEMEI
ncbi:MAG: MBL fold metallo-hydrolase [Bacillota bacterium]